MCLIKHRKGSKFLRHVSWELDFREHAGNSTAKETFKENCTCQPSHICFLKWWKKEMGKDLSLHFKLRSGVHSFNNLQSIPYVLSALVWVVEFLALLFPSCPGFCNSYNLCFCFSLYNLIWFPGLWSAGPTRKRRISLSF